MGIAAIQSMKTCVKFLAYPCLSACLFTLATAGEARYQSRESLAQQAVDYVYGQADRFSVDPKVTAGELDRRLRLPRCDQPLEGFESPSGLSAGRTVVGVRCDGSHPWKLYVPVEIALPAQVITLNHPMRRGEIIQKADLSLQEADLAKLRGHYFQDSDEVAGLRLKRNVAANLPLKPAMLDAERLVKRGAEVVIVSDSDTIQVRMRGKAMGQGGKGDRIKVKNLRSGRVLTATVVDRGTVRVNP